MCLGNLQLQPLGDCSLGRLWAEVVVKVSAFDGLMRADREVMLIGASRATGSLQGSKWEAAAGPLQDTTHTYTHTLHCPGHRASFVLSQTVQCREQP